MPTTPSNARGQNQPHSKQAAGFAGRNQNPIGVFLAKTEPNNGKTDGQSAQEAEFRVVSVKLRPAELAELDAVCAELGVKRNRLLRTLARKAAGFLEPDEAVASALKQTTRQIGGIANNINQIAHHANILEKSGEVKPEVLERFNVQLNEYVNLKKDLLQCFKNIL